MAAQLTDDGPVIETLDQVENGLNSEFVDTFGNKIDLSPQGYTGREIPIIARSIAQLQNLTAETSQALNLDSAQGRQLDAAGVLLDEERNGAVRSTIPTTLFGLPGIAVGDRRVRYRRNDTVWRTPVNGTDGLPLVIGANGTVAATLAAVDTGPVEASQDGTGQWIIVDKVVGWTAVESVGDATLGTPVEGDPAYRSRLRLAGKSSGVGTEPGVQRGIFGVPGVISLRLENNRENFPVNGVPGKFSEAIVDGGDQTTIFQTLLNVYGGTDGFAGTLTGQALDAFGKSRTVKYTPVDRVDVVLDITIDTTGAELELPDNAEDTTISVTAERVNSLTEGADVQPDDIAGQIRAAFEGGTIPDGNILVLIGLKGGPPPVAAPFAITLRQRARTFASVQAAQVVGTQTQTFAFDVTWILGVAIDGGNVQLVTFSVGDFGTTAAATALEVATAINNGSTGLTAGSQNGAVTIASDTLGASSSVNITTNTSAGLLAALGFSLGAVFGSDGDIAVTII